MARRGSKFMLVALFTAAALGIGAQGAGAGADDTLNTGPIRRSIRKDLADIGVPLKVTCPSTKAGAKKLTCKIQIEGQTVHVKVKVAGSRFTWKRVEAVLLHDEMKSFLERGYSEEVAAGAATLADCGYPDDQVTIVAEVGSTLPCIVTVEGGASEELIVLVKDFAGNVEVRRP